MNNPFLRRLLDGLRYLASDQSHAGRVAEGDFTYTGYTASPWSHLWGRNPELLNAEDEVAGERQGRLVVYSRSAPLCSALLGRFRQQPPAPMTTVVAREGFFTLVALPDGGGQPPGQNPATAPDSVDDAATATSDGGDDGWPHASHWRDGWSGNLDAADLLAETGSGADLLLFLFTAADSWQRDDARWFARLRALSAPVLPVMMVATPADDSATGVDEPLLSQLRQQLGVRPVVVMCGSHPNTAPVAEDEPAKSSTSPAAPRDLLELVQRILAVRPRLAMALAQEAPACRRFIAHRVIRTGAWVTALVGSEPVPLLDLPLHIAMQWKVALQLATIYGRPGLDYRSREMVSAVTLNLFVRYLAQQAVKLLPVIGWMLSAALSGMSTLFLGHALLRYYEEERFLPDAPLLWRAAKRRLSTVRVRRTRRKSS